MSVEVRLLTLKDLEAFRKLRLRALKGEPGSFCDAYEDVVKWPSERFAKYFKNGWIAGGFLDGELVGMAGLYRHVGKKIQHKGTIWGIYVAPLGRGRRLGQRMIEKLLQEARRAKLELLLLSTSTMTLHTQRLYQSLGFETYGVEKHILKLADGSYVDDILMMKFLKQSR